jgi:hypothetical protein
MRTPLGWEVKTKSSVATNDADYADFDPLNPRNPRLNPRFKRFIVVGLAVLAVLGPGAHLGEAQQIRVEGAFPRQLQRGQATLINVAVPNRDDIQAVEISPSAGVRVSGIKRGENFQGALTWSELTIEVADDAAPGNRTLVLVLPMGRTAPVAITIPSHVPSISDLRVLSVQSSPPGFELQVAAVDVSADLGDSPYVWFMIGCAGEIHPGVIHGKVTLRDKNNGVVRASAPNLPMAAGAAAAANGKCDLQVRVTDSGGVESNTLKTTIDFRN